LRRYDFWRATSSLEAVVNLENTKKNNNKKQKQKKQKKNNNKKNYKKNRQNYCL
jgi:hypothetical protein